MALLLLRGRQQTLCVWEREREREQERTGFPPPPFNTFYSLSKKNEGCSSARECNVNNGKAAGKCGTEGISFPYKNHVTSLNMIHNGSAKAVHAQVKNPCCRRPYSHVAWFCCTGFFSMCMSGWMGRSDSLGMGPQFKAWVEKNGDKEWHEMLLPFHFRDGYSCSFCRGKKQNNKWPCS